MQYLLVILGCFLLVFLMVQLFTIKSRRGTEKYKYKVIKRYPNFELRQYEASLFTSVQLPGNQYAKFSGLGFSKLAGYIFGDNERNQKIAMTSPVSLSLGDTMTMRFMVPGKYNKSTLPKPNQPDITFVEEPAKKVAAIRFSGWASDGRIASYQAKFKTALEAEGIKFSGPFYFFGYNAPYEVFSRRNELIVTVDGY